MPWPIERVLTPAVTRINRIEIGYRQRGRADRVTGASQGGRDVLEESLMLTGDENIIDINFAVFWKIKQRGRLPVQHAQPGTDLVKAVAESSMREVIGRTPIQPALTELRAQIETDVLHQTQQILDRYKTGVEITQVQLQKVDPPAEVVESFRRRAARQHRRRTPAQRGRSLSERHRAARPRRCGTHRRRRAGRAAGLDRAGDRADAALPLGAGGLSDRRRT